MRVSVIGGSQCSDRGAELAEAVGRELAERGHDLICGGLTGVMEHACRGAREADRGEASDRASGVLASEASEGSMDEGSESIGETASREAGGHTIGILPGEDRAAANPHVETAVATGLGNARNVLVVLNGDAVIAVEGATGTLSELGHALDLGRPVAGLGTHRIEGLDGIAHVDSAEAAVEHVERAVGERV